MFPWEDQVKKGLMCFEQTALRGTIKQMAEHLYSLDLSWHFLHEHGCDTSSPAQRSRTWNHQHWPILDQDIIRVIPYGNSAEDVLQLCHLLLALRYWLKNHTSFYSSLRIGSKKKDSLAVKNMQICWSPDLKADGSTVAASRVFDQASIFAGERNNRFCHHTWGFFWPSKQ